jgi:hypothetical protein
VKGLGQPRPFLFVDIQTGYNRFMFNRQRTLEVFGYDLDPAVRRRTDAAFNSTNKVTKKDLLVVDNCPSCQKERHVKLRQSRKNTLCLKCFHSSPEMLEAKRNQNKIKSEETKAKMSANHWSTKGMMSPFKGQIHSEEVKGQLRNNGIAQYENISDEEFELHKIKSSLQNGRTLETFKGFTSSEGTRIRQSKEGKAWSYDVLAKSNFTCIKCNTRGGSLHAHHKNAFNSFPEQRLDVGNGACLCEICHDEFHVKYGKGNNTKEQFDEWLRKT